MGGYLIFKEVVDIVGVSIQTFWKWRRTSNIPIGSKYHGKQVLYTVDEIELIRKFLTILNQLTCR